MTYHILWINEDVVLQRRAKQIFGCHFEDLKQNYSLVTFLVQF